MAEGSIFKRCSCRDQKGASLGVGCPKLRRPGGWWSPTHGRWGYQLELPPTPAGKRRQLRRGGFDTRDAALAERDQAKTLLALAGGHQAVAVEIATLLTESKAGAPLPDRDTIARRVRAGIPATVDTTVAEYLHDWHASRRGIEAGTLRTYGIHIRMYLVPHLGHIALEALQVSHVEAMFHAIENRNADIANARVSDDPAERARVRGVRTVSPASMHRIRACLRKALNDAMRGRNRLIDFNPAAHVELPSGKRPKARVWTAGAVARWRATGERPSPVMVWTPAQAGAFLDHAEAHDIVLYAMFTLILHRGLRRGEACGLREADVDLDNQLVVISQQITTLGYTPIIKKVKSEAGDRVVPLDKATVTALHAYQARKARWRLVNGPSWADTGLFFVQPDGTAWHPNTVSNRFEQLVAGSGLPPIRLHDLRHCAATYLKAAGADLTTVKETLGHSSITITADTYTSVITELERATAEAASQLIPRTKPHAA
jgi:integrase